MRTFVDMRLISCVEFDLRHCQLTVLEQWSEKRFLRTVRHEQQQTYTLAIGVGRFMDGDRYVLPPDPRHYRLVALWAAWHAERRLDAYVGIDGDQREMPLAARESFGPLPPVPLLALRPSR